MTAVSRTPEEAAATVRAALTYLPGEAWLGQRDDALAALDSLVAALRDARREAEAWLTPFDGSGVEWHEKQIGWKYVYQASDFCKLVAAVHEYEVRALQAESERDQARDAIAEAVRLCEADVALVACSCEDDPDSLCLAHAVIDALGGAAGEPK